MRFLFTKVLANIPTEESQGASMCFSKLRNLPTIALLVFGHGCTQQPIGHQAVSVTGTEFPQKRYEHLTQSNDDVTVELIATSLPGDSDFIPKNNQWVQYQLQIKNTGKAALEIGKGEIVDQNGIHRDACQKPEQIYAEPHPNAAGVSAALTAMRDP